MPIRYSSMQGAGNRILVVDARSAQLEPPSPDALRRLADEATGPGFDQLMWLYAAGRPASAASYRVFNQDGSEVEQCGNGSRCVARLLAGEAVEGCLELDSPAGPVIAALNADGSVAVNMGVPRFEPAALPFIADEVQDSYELDVDGRAVAIAAVSMGNPHCVIDVDDIGAAPVAELGPVIEKHERFPDRVNVGFRQLVDRGEINLRVYERGAGETLACGTGACAAAVTGRSNGRLDDVVTVNLPGGQLMVSWSGPGEPVWLTGNAELIDEGTLDL
jgi:diaminopimelate epimerase